MGFVAVRICESGVGPPSMLVFTASRFTTVELSLSILTRKSDGFRIADQFKRNHQSSTAAVAALASYGFGIQLSIPRVQTSVPTFRVRLTVHFPILLGAPNNLKDVRGYPDLQGVLRNGRADPIK
jgi:hypothetical protein